MALADREQHYAHMTLSGQADGILLFTFYLPFETDGSKPFLAQLPPLVDSCEAIPMEGINKVMIDNCAAARTAVNHLLDFGHSRIAAVMGPSGTPSTLQRFKGYKLALIETGLDIDDSLIMRGDYGMDPGSSAMEKLLKLRQRPTAVFCFSDDIAIGAMSVLREYGFNIPQDISVMGFDDIRYANLMSPALTTIHQPLEDIGKACTQLLLQQLAAKLTEATYIELPYTLIVRQSTGAVPTVQ
jgi:LacI family repressor for deo operon, udp, cdd, tsx, nupC, and nupG